jgi:hypothetical protein
MPIASSFYRRTADSEAVNARIHADSLLRYAALRYVAVIGRWRFGRTFRRRPCRRKEGGWLSSPGDSASNNESCQIEQIQRREDRGSCHQRTEPKRCGIFQHRERHYIPAAAQAASSLASRAKVSLPRGALQLDRGFLKKKRPATPKCCRPPVSQVYGGLARFEVGFGLRD